MIGVNFDVVLITDNQSKLGESMYLGPVNFDMKLRISNIIFSG